MARKREDADPSKAIAYLRVSTQRQYLSPDAQRDAIAAWAKREGAPVVAWHADLGVSGGAELDKRHSPGPSPADRQEIKREVRSPHSHRVTTRAACASHSTAT